MIFFFKKKNLVFGYSWSTHYGIGATISIGREMLCLPYAGFFTLAFKRAFFVCYKLHNCCLYRYVAVLFCSSLFSNIFYAVLSQNHFCRNLRTTFLAKIVFVQTLLRFLKKLSFSISGQQYWIVVQG